MGNDQTRQGDDEVSELRLSWDYRFNRISYSFASIHLLFPAPRPHPLGSEHTREKWIFPLRLLSLLHVVLAHNLETLVIHLRHEVKPTPCVRLYLGSSRLSLRDIVVVQSATSLVSLTMNWRTKGCSGPPSTRATVMLP